MSFIYKSRLELPYSLWKNLKKWSMRDKEEDEGTRYEGKKYRVSKKITFLETLMRQD